MFALSQSMSWEVRIRRGTVRIESPSRGVLIASFRGMCGEEHVAAATRLLDQWIDEGLEVVVAIDSRDLGGAEPGYRRSWSAWLKAHGRHVRRVEVLPRPNTYGARAAGRVRRHASALSFTVAVAEAAAA